VGTGLKRWVLVVFNMAVVVTCVASVGKAGELSQLKCLWGMTAGGTSIGLSGKTTLAAVQSATACATAIGQKESKERGQRQKPKLKELTIRNVTKQRIRYWIKPYGSDDPEQERVIEPKQIDRYPGDDAMDIRFFSDGREKSYRLDPGRPYSFRYDSEGRVDLYQGAHGRADAPDLAPWVPTPMEIAHKMLELAKVTSKDVVYDLGCGDGRIVILAAQKYKAKGVGVDIDPQRIKECHIGAKKAGVTKLVKFILGDATKVDVSDCTVLCLYLLSESNELLRPKLEKQLRPGTRVVAHDYPVPGWKPKKKVTVTDKSGKEHDLYLYIR